MSTVLTELGLVVTAIISNATSLVGLITSTPLLLIPFAFSLIGGTVYLFKSLKR